MPRLPRAAIPTACALVGAIIMPHNLFLHSLYLLLELESSLSHLAACVA